MPKEFYVDRSTSASLWVCHCGWEKCEKNHSFGPGVRDHFLIHFVVGGCGRYKNSSGEYHLSRGQGFLITPGETAAYTADGADPWEYYWVGFKGVEARHLLSLCGIGQQNPVISCGDTPRLEGLFASLFEAYRVPNAREYAMLAYLYLILSELMAGQNPKSRPTEPAGVYLDRALAYINDNYSYEISIAGVASYIGIDRTYLYRIFTESLNLSPARYLQKVRMTRAADLLKTTDLSVVQIAVSTGFKDLSHFSGNFKRFFGVSPSVYRRQFI